MLKRVLIRISVCDLDVELNALLCLRAARGAHPIAARVVAVVRDLVRQLHQASRQDHRSLQQPAHQGAQAQPGDAGHRRAVDSAGRVRDEGRAGPSDGRAQDHGGHLQLSQQRGPGRPRRGVGSSPSGVTHHYGILAPSVVWLCGSSLSESVRRVARYSRAVSLVGGWSPAPRKHCESSVLLVVL